MSPWEMICGSFDLAWINISLNIPSSEAVYQLIGFPFLARDKPGSRGIRYELQAGIKPSLGNDYKSHVCILHECSFLGGHCTLRGVRIP